MIKSFDLENYGPITKITGSDLGQINLVLGKNSTGKTFLIKALYSAIRSHEQSNKGDSNQSFEDILSDKLYWTFQTGKIGDIVARGEGKKLKMSLKLKEESSLVFGFGRDTNNEGVI